MGLIESIRKWIDGDTTPICWRPLTSTRGRGASGRISVRSPVKSRLRCNAKCSRRRWAHYIPREYIVYLSSEDDKDWQGDSVVCLEQGLFHVLSERARELSGSTQLATKSFAVECAWMAR